MKIIKILMAFIGISAIWGIGTAFSTQLPSEKEIKTENVSKKQTENDVLKDKNEKANDNVKQETKKVDEETKQIFSDSNSSNQEDNKKVTNNSNESKQQEEKTVIVESKNSSNEVIQSSPAIPDENPTNDTTPWGALGISEYDYYHKPANKDITNYYKKTAECEAEGSKLDHYMCMQVNSYSGDIVGYMLIY